jgi:hypothetical protein
MHRQALCLAFVIAALSLSLSFSQEPVKPTWPNEFQIPFGLNWGILMENASAMMYYNFDQAQAQLLDYMVHCFPLVKYNSVYHPCQMWFVPKGNKESEGRERGVKRVEEC